MSKRTRTVESKSIVGYMCDLCGDHIGLHDSKGKLIFDDTHNHTWEEADFCPHCFGKFKAILEAFGGKLKEI